MMKASPDGYTIGSCSGEWVSLKELNLAPPGFDYNNAEKIMHYNFDPAAIVVPVDSPYKTLEDLVVAAKAKPGDIIMGVTAAGGAHHLSMLLFQERSGIEFNILPYSEGASGVIGAVLVSRSSYGILLNLYRVRLDIIKIFCVSLLASLSLSLLLSFTITRPLKRLRAEAERVLDTSGKFSGHFRGLARGDEIGDLSRSLAALSVKLEKRTAFIDTFISDLYHELKNPLAAIRGQTELSLASPEKEEKLLAGIQAEEQRMERLLARLRELSRIDSGKEERPERILLADFIPLLAERYAPAGVVSFTNLSGSRAAVWMNPDSLTQVLTNPLDNAFSFSPPRGKVTVHLEAEEETAPDRFWRITIDDEGPGIREETGGRYFERFYSERPAEEKPRHSGLGLAIVKAICESVGGRCSLENRRAGGCRFLLYLPRYPDSL
jgi:two-component system sensor histidine kinase ChvG